MRCLVVANRALLSRRHLEEQAARWLAEAGETPPGNGPEQALWEVSNPDTYTPFGVYDMCLPGSRDAAGQRARAGPVGGD